MPSRPKSIADGRFDIEVKLGEGSFGEVFRGSDRRTGAAVAIKFEENQGAAMGSLKNEAYLLDMLRRPFQRHGFVEVLHFSRQGNWSVMVMELLGKSLEDCIEDCGGTFSVATTTLIAEQAIHRLEYLHSKCIVHRDIKPENFMWGIGRKIAHLYVIDLGLSVRYWDRRHVSMSSTNSLTGTARYASIRAHKGYTQSRRDDLEAVGHMLMYFLRGILPWSGLKGKTMEEKFKKIAETKANYPLSDLCKGFPDEFKTYLQYARGLGFKERPDYAMLLKMFGDVRKREGVVEDWELQWLVGQDVDVNNLIPMDAGCGHQQPDDGKKEKNCFRWSRRATQRTGVKNQDTE